MADFQNRQFSKFFVKISWIGQFRFLFAKKKKSFTNNVVEWMGLNFDVFPGFQQIPCYA